MIFHLQSQIDSLNNAENYRFKLIAKNQQEFIAWQNEFRTALIEILCIDLNKIPKDFQATEISFLRKETYSEVKYSIQLEDVLIPFYLLIPHAPPPYKAMMAFHGHAPSVHQILGNYPDEATRLEMIAQDENFAQRFAEDGYLVCAIEQRGFGERVTEQQSKSRKQNSCRHLSFEYLLHGKTLLGERIRDAVAVLNYLGSRNDILQDKIASTGHSGGATTALFLSALDERLFSTIISGYFCSYKHSILGMEHCECNYIPHLLELADIGEITALIAPRYLQIIHGKQDPIFPIEGLDKAYPIVQKAYSLCMASQACSLSLHQGAHRYDYQLVFNWLSQKKL